MKSNMVTDKTGRKLRVGQIVNVMLIGMFEGKLVDIKDMPVILSPQQQVPPHLIITTLITPYIAPNGVVPDVYIIGNEDPNDPVVKQWEERNRMIRPS